MWVDPETIPLAVALRDHFPTFHAEWSTLSRGELVPWVIPEAYTGTWLLYPLFAWNAAELGMAAAVQRAAQRCPRTVAFLQRVPGLTSAAFSTMWPGTHIYPHVDAETPRVLRCHLGIDVPPDNVFRVGGETRPWRRGEVMAFDGQTEHEGANLGTLPRTILMVDVTLQCARSPLAAPSPPP